MEDIISRKDKFESFEELRLRLTNYAAKNNLDFHVHNSRTLEAAKKNCPLRVEKANASLKYYFITYKCIHGGDYRKRTAGIRQTKSYRKNCPFRIDLKLQEDGQALVVENICEEHNHEVSQALFKQLPKQRRLPENLQQKIGSLLRLGVKKKVVQEKFGKETDKVITIRDLTNICRRVKKWRMPVIVVHGGASRVPSFAQQLKIKGVQRATNLGYEALLQGTALDAVEAAVKVMEEDPIFNAGVGSSLTSSGEVEMDAIIMEGTHMKVGAVAGVREVASPVSLSRKVMEQSDHVLLMGDGAHQFAQLIGMPLIPPQELVTKYAQDRLEEFQTFNNVIKTSMSLNDHDTVGAVAIDGDGCVACATSTGGITAKMCGRVGDTPLVGAGGYADDFVGAVSTTGHGEAIMRVCLARHVTGLMQQGMSAQEAVVAGLDHMKTRIQGYGGAICVSNIGEVGVHFTTEHMPWAYRKGNTLNFGFRPNENMSQSVKVDISL